MVTAASEPELAGAILDRITDIQIGLDRIGLEAAGKYLQIFKVSGEDYGAQKVPAVTFGASYGDAFLAGLAVGVIPSYDHITSWVKYDRVIQPDVARFESYSKYYRVYTNLYQINKGLMSDLHSLA